MVRVRKAGRDGSRVAAAAGQDRGGGGRRRARTSWLIAVSWLSAVAAVIAALVRARRRGGISVDRVPHAPVVSRVARHDGAGPDTVEAPSAAPPESMGDEEPTPTPEQAPASEAAPAPEAAPASQPAPASEPSGAADGPYGPGSASPAEDGSGPEGFTVKGNESSKLFHTPDSPNYARTHAAVWFRDEDAARAAGFRHWDRRRRQPDAGGDGGQR